MDLDESELAYGVVYLRIHLEAEPRTDVSPRAKRRQVFADSPPAASGAAGGA